LHQRASRSAAREQVVGLFRTVGIPEPEERIASYPHQLSGGMRQRVMIAMALACRPELLMADEPTTSLDVTIQAQILALLRRLQREIGMSILLITHDLGVVAEVCERVLVMYAGRIVEEASVSALFERPRHPYTLGLLRSVPRIGAPEDRLREIPGTVPPLAQLPNGCRFHDRCDRAVDRCASEEPKLINEEPGHFVRCFNPAP
jgi:oligopeptide/dipeptide ABC transporter ATP-binding protein